MDTRGKSKVTLETLVNQFNKDPQVELEMRTQITKPVFDKLVEFYKKEPFVIEQTLNIITNIGNNIPVIETRFFKDGKQDINKKLYSKKQKLLTLVMKNPRNHKIVTSREIPATSSEFTINSSSIYRFKWRYSILLADWNLDITFSIQLTDSKKVKEVKEKFFRNSNLKDLPEDYDRIELELERKTREITVEDFNILDDLFRVTDETEFMNMDYNHAITIIAKLLHVPINKYNQITIKQLTNRVYDLTKNKLSELRPELSEYYITDKADGEHSLVLCQIGKGSLKLTIVNSKLVNVEIPSKNTSEIQNYIIDAEVVNGNIYAFDLLLNENKDLRNEKFSERYELLCKLIQKEIGKKVEKVGVEAKYMKKLGSDIEKVTAEFVKYNKSRPYETDGYILTKDAEYMEVGYKLKYLSHVSIDFMVMKAPAGFIGIEPYGKKKGCELYLLFVGISHKNFVRFNMERINQYNAIFTGKNLNNEYFPIQFMPSSEPYAYIYWHSGSEDLDNKICEMRWDMQKCEWHLMRIREDRDADLLSGIYYGNDFAVAEKIWQSYYNPVNIEDLYSSDEGYFKVHNNPIYAAVRNFNAYAKTMIMNAAISRLKQKFKNDRLVAIDLAAGKGQDIAKFQREFSHTVFVDIDSAALQEIVDRKQTPQKKFHNQEAEHSMRYSILQADLNQDYKKTVKEINKFTSKAHLIVCNLAIHYLTESEAGMKNITNLVRELLAPGGIFVYTTFNGESVFNLLKDSNWNVKIGDRLKYSIVKDYRSDELSVGQKIKAILPFTNGEYYEETLVNYRRLNSIMGESGLKTLDITQFGQLIDGYKNRADLDEDDRKFAKLYMGCILSLESTTGGIKSRMMKKK